MLSTSTLTTWRIHLDPHTPDELAMLKQNAVASCSRAAIKVTDHVLEALIVMNGESHLTDMHLKILPGDWRTQHFNEEEFHAFARSSCGLDDLVHDSTAKCQRSDLDVAHATSVTTAGASSKGCDVAAASSSSDAELSAPPSSVVADRSRPTVNRLGRALRQPVWRALEDAAVTAELTRLETPPSKRTRKCDSLVTAGGAWRAFSTWAVCDRCNKWRKCTGAPLGLDSVRFDCAMVKRLCAESEDELSAGEEEMAGTRVGCSRTRVGSCEGQTEQFAERKKGLVSSRGIAAWAMCEECSKWRKLSKRHLPLLQDETVRFECAMIKRMCAQPEDEMSDDEVWDERVVLKLNELAEHVLTEVDIANQQAEIQADFSDKKPSPRQRRTARAARVVQQFRIADHKQREQISRLVSDIAAQRRQRQPMLSKGIRSLRFASDCTGAGGSVLGTYDGLKRVGIDATHVQGTEDLDSRAGKHARRIAMAREDIFGKGSHGVEDSGSKEGGCVLLGASDRSAAVPIPDDVLLVTTGMICRNHSPWRHEPAPEETDAVCSEHVMRVNAQQSVRVALLEEVPGFLGPSLDQYLANLDPRFDSHAFTVLNGTGAGDHHSRHRLHVLSTASRDAGALQAACVFSRLLSPKENSPSDLSPAEISRKQPRSFSFQTGVSENWFNGSCGGELRIYVGHLCAYNSTGNIAVFHGSTGVFLCVSSAFLAAASGFPMHWQSVYRTNEAARKAGLSNAQSPRKEAVITEALGRELVDPTHWTSYPCLRGSQLLGRGRALPRTLSELRGADGSARDFSLKARIVWFDRLLDAWFLSPMGYEFARAKPPESLTELISDFAPANGQRGGFPSRLSRGNRLKPVTCAVTLRRLAHASELTGWEKRRAQLQADHYAISS